METQCNNILFYITSFVDIQDNNLVYVNKRFFRLFKEQWETDAKRHKKVLNACLIQNNLLKRPVSSENVLDFIQDEDDLEMQNFVLDLTFKSDEDKEKIQGQLELLTYTVYTLSRIYKKIGVFPDEAEPRKYIRENWKLSHLLTFFSKHLIGAYKEKLNFFLHSAFVSEEIRMSAIDVVNEYFVEYYKMVFKHMPDELKSRDTYEWETRKNYFSDYVYFCSSLSDITVRFFSNYPLIVAQQEYIRALAYSDVNNTAMFRNITEGILQNVPRNSSLAYDIAREKYNRQSLSELASLEPTEPTEPTIRYIKEKMEYLKTFFYGINTRKRLENRCLRIPYLPVAKASIYSSDFLNAIPQKISQISDKLERELETLFMTRKSAVFDALDEINALGEIARTHDRLHEYFKCQRAGVELSKHLIYNHPAQFTQYYLLALVIEKSGDYIKAIDMLLITLKNRKNNLPLDHPDIQKTVSKLAELYLKIGDTQEYQRYTFDMNLPESKEYPNDKILYRILNNYPVEDELPELGELRELGELGELDDDFLGLQPPALIRMQNVSLPIPPSFY